MRPPSQTAASPIDASRTTAGQKPHPKSPIRPLRPSPLYSSICHEARSLSGWRISCRAAGRHQRPGEKSRCGSTPAGLHGLHGSAERCPLTASCAVECRDSPQVLAIVAMCAAAVPLGSFLAYNSKPRKCKTCYGAGYYPCPTCHGRGKVSSPGMQGKAGMINTTSR